MTGNRHKWHRIPTPAAVAALVTVTVTEPGALARGLHRWTYHGHHTHHHTHEGTT